VHAQPPTPTKQAGSDDVVTLAEQIVDPVSTADPPPAPPETRVPELRTHADAVIAEVDDRKVGESRLVPLTASWGVRVYVHPAWRRRGLGLSLLRATVVMAVERGITELEVRLDARDLGGLRLVLASGLCGSIRCDDGETRTRLVLSRGAVPAASR
jgi:GNAT superfamily N-acetyltransferase